jgi:hypothetical protein
MSEKMMTISWNQSALLRSLTLGLPKMMPDLNRGGLILRLKRPVKSTIARRRVWENFARNSFTSMALKTTELLH